VLKPTAKVRPIFGFACIWLMPGSWYSTGSSTVIMFREMSLILFKDA